MRKLAATSILIVIVALATLTLTWVFHPTSAANVYVAQVASGGNNGTSCANSYGIAFFNNSANWGSGTVQIGPGTTVHLCGTFSVPLTANGSGTNGNPITIHFESGASISMPALPTTGALVLTGLSYIVVDGGGGACGYNPATLSNVPCSQGVIQATANGTGLANQINSIAIMADSTSNVEIKGLLFSNIYVHSSTSDAVTSRTWGVRAYQFPVNLSIHNVTAHDVGWFLDGGGNNLQFYNNEVYHMDHGVGSGGPLTGVQVYGNHFHDMANWDTTSNAYHHDGIHIFTDNGAVSNAYLYANVFDGDMGNNVTSWLYLEASSGTFNNRWVFNNYFFIAPGRNSCCGLEALYSDGGTSSSGGILNNTVAGTGISANGASAGANGILVGSGQSGAFVQNNVVAVTPASGAQPNIAGVNSGAGITTISNNAYTTGNGSNAWNWKGSFTGTYATWAASSGETNGFAAALSAMNLNAAGQPQTGSDLIGAAVNLTTSCTGNLVPLCSDLTGAARPSSGSWTIGAFNATGSTAPAVSFSPTSVAFGNQQQSSTSPSQPVTLTNTGTATLSISSISFTGTNAADFNQTNTCGSSLAAGSNCTISVTFTPSTVGTESASLSLASNAPGSPNAVPLTGTGTTPPVPGAGFSPTSLAFGNQTQRTTSAAQSITLTNTGTATLTISMISITGTNAADFGQTNNCPASLTASSTCTINATFTPSLLAAESASISMTDNASGSPHTVAMTGTGTAVPAPSVSLSPASVNFGNQRVGTTSGGFSVTLRNTGNATLIISGISVTGTNAADFAQTNTCPASLGANASCTITSTISPSTIGTRSASISIANNAGNTPQTVPLTGIGTSLPALPTGTSTPVLLTQ